MGGGGGRLLALDGLRGLAALVVVVHHALLAWQVLADQYFVANPDSISWWITFTPLHLAWAGTEAVMVFFVLSGLVLALPFLGGGTGLARWRVLLRAPAGPAVRAGRRVARPRRPARLGVPSGARSDDELRASTRTRFPVDASTVLRDAVLLLDMSWIHPSLWSLKYEVLFSLLLPLYVLAARRFAHRPAVLIGTLLALAGIGTYVGSATLAWLPVFGVGVTMAASRVRLHELGRRIESSRRPVAVWSSLAGVAVLLLLAEWWSRAVYPPTALALAIPRPAAICGAALVCFLAMACPGVSRLCVRRPVRWLGTVSFSLYLVHEPILVSVSSMVGGSKRGVVVTLVVGIGLSLVAAAAFHRLVELPSQRVARAVGGRLQHWSGPRCRAFPGAGGPRGRPWSRPCSARRRGRSTACGRLRMRAPPYRLVSLRA